MRKYQIYALLQFDSASSGNAAAGVEFNVYNAGGGLATIYAQNGASPISQSSPLVTDSNGRYEFYAENGRYSILFTDETIASQNDLTDVSIYEYGSAGALNVATNAQALAGTAGVIPDAAGVHASFNQYGIGSTTTDIDVINDTTAKSGLYRTPVSGSPAGAVNWHTVFMNRLGGAQSAVIQIRDTVSTTAPDMYIRHRGGDGIWGDPARVYHSENTNFNEFGGLVGVVGTGYAATSAVARFFLPLNSKAKPTSITIVGEFEIYRTNTLLGTVTSLDYNSTLSSSKILVMQVGGLTLTDGDFLDIRAKTAASKIKVNF